MREADPEHDRGAGITVVADPDRPDDVYRFQIAGELFPRLIIDPRGPNLFGGDGTAYPTNELLGVGGVSDHSALSHRSDVDSHPVSAITGLVAALAAKDAALATHAAIIDGSAHGINDLISAAVIEGASAADAITVADVADYYLGTDAEAVLAEVGTTLADDETRLSTVEAEFDALPLVRGGLQVTSVIDPLTGDLVIGRDYTKTTFDPDTDSGLQLTLLDEYIAVAGTFTGASATILLPATDDVPPGFPIEIHDEDGLLDDAHWLVIGAAGGSGNVISPGPFFGAYVMTATKGTVRFRSNGLSGASGQWDLVATSVATAAGFNLDLATESLLYSISLDKFASAKADINAGGHRHINVDTPLLPTDAATKLYADGGSRVTFSDAPVTLTTAATTYLAQIGTMSAIRAVNLPSAATVGEGHSILVADESGTVTPAFYIAVTASGGDTILQGALTLIAPVSRPYGGLVLQSDGVSKWTARAYDGIGWSDRRAVRTVANTNDTATNLDNTIVYTSLSTSSKTVTLPGAASMQKGDIITVRDASGNATTGPTPLVIIVSRAGTDTIVGGDIASTLCYVQAPYGEVKVQADPANNRWFLVQNGYTLRAQNLGDVLSAPTSRYNLHDQVLPSVHTVATANVASKSGTTTINGVALVAGNYVLLTAQTAGAENGPWIIAAGAWTRPLDYPAGGTVISRICACGSGVYAGTLWESTNLAAVTVDTTATTWVRCNSRDGKTNLADTVGYAALATDRWISFTSITASRALTLPLAASVPAGTPLIVSDDSGSVTSSITITCNRNTADTIVGGTLSVAASIAIPNTGLMFLSDGVSKWHVCALGAQMTYDPGLATVDYVIPGALAVKSAITTQAYTLTNKRITRRSSAIAGGSATVSVNTDNFDLWSLTTITGVCTLNSTGTPVEGDEFIVRLKANGAYAMTWGSTFVAEGATMTATTTANKVHTNRFIYDSVKAKWGCVSSVTEA